MSFNVGVVGATGLVGDVFLKLLIERSFPVNELRLFTSENHLGHKIQVGSRVLTCEVLNENSFKGLDIVFFSAGDDISRKWAPIAAASGAFAIDNSAAFRMSTNHKLIVPEVNGHLIPNIKDKKEVIANPNCSTIQLVVALAPLAINFGIHDVHVASYQSVSGAGKEAREEFLQQVKALSTNPKANLTSKYFAHPIGFNSIPEIGSFDENGFCSEEVKIMNETKKIMSMPKLSVSAFTVRVPTYNCHGEAVWVMLDQEAHIDDIRDCMSKFSGIEVFTEANKYPTVVYADGRDPVFVGRLHLDPHNSRKLMMWVVADNLRKGAALNGIQIAEKIID